MYPFGFRKASCRATMSYHLAQINIGRLIAPIDDPKIAEFVAQLEPINALADKARGFVWRLQSASGNATDITYDERDRAKWFEKMDKPVYCLWWIPAGHIPTVAEGRERLEHYQQYGATPFSFWFSQHFPQPADKEVLV